MLVMRTLIKVFSLFWTLVLLFVLSEVGALIVRWTALPVPQALVGILLLLGLLCALGRVPAFLQCGARFLLSHFMLLFIPAVAGIVVYLKPLQGQWAAVLIACAAGTVVALWVTAVVFVWALKRACKTSQDTSQ